MKTSALLAFFFFCVVVGAGAEYVRDSEGRLVPNGGTYVLRGQSIQGAAVTGINVKNPDTSCSLAVVESLNSNGNTVRVQSPLRSAYITTGYALQVSFDPLPSNQCTRHPEWIVANDLDFQQLAVMSGDAREFSNPVSGYFYFQAYNSARHFYTLRFCSSPNSCGTLALRSDNDGRRRLVVNNAQLATPFVFNLVRATNEHISMVV